jgi:cytochrome c oxidase subunit II
MPHYSNIFPIFHPASGQADAISRLFILVLLICAAIFAVVVFLAFFALLRYRGRPDSPEPRQLFGNPRLEIAWTVIPFLIVTWLMVLTAKGMFQSDPAASRKPDLIVIGHQWWWEIRYPQTGLVTANEIHIPIGARIGAQKGHGAGPSQSPLAGSGPARNLSGQLR